MISEQLLLIDKHSVSNNLCAKLRLANSERSTMMIIFDLLFTRYSSILNAFISCQLVGTLIKSNL